MKNNISNKAQMWFTDFVIAILIFSFILIPYYTYTVNISKQDSSAMDELVSDAKTISPSLLSEGYPSDWNADNVIRIGFTDSYNRIDNEKFEEFMKMDYNKTKELLGITHDYILFFVNESGDIENIEGLCGFGECKVDVSYDLTTAYYYEGDIAGGEDYMKSFMENEFGADVYCEKASKCSGSLYFNDFLSNISNYEFIVVEHPYWSKDQFSDFETAADPWLQAGGILFVGGELPAPNKFEAFGVEFNKISGVSEKFGLATVVNDDEYLVFKEGKNLIFTQEYHVIDVPPINDDFIDIVRFNGTYVEFDDIKENGDIAIARWSYGEGKILFFSDFEAAYLAGDFQKNLEISIRAWLEAKCSHTDKSNMDLENLVKINRLVIYNSKIVRMVIYLCK